ncbi:MAG: ABC transporter permease subunit [Planctomycetota bacterium]|nr:MAG: ABC transporter permease subunit [Planctomycetota bacterium]
MADAERAATRRPGRAWLALAAALTIAALFAIDWRFDEWAGAAGRARAFERLRGLGGAAVAPDFSAETLRLGWRLSLDTLAIAAWGTLLGALGGFLLAIPATRALVLGVEPPARGVRRLRHLALRALLELARLLLDALRGVPDFAWAVLISTLPGPGPITGVCAIALSVAGILGKIYSEHWDALAQRRLAPGLATGAGRIGMLAYLVQPLCARASLSYTLMRAECAVRNASVIGAVGGGGLGGQMLEEFSYGNDRGAVTLLLFLVAVTASADLATNWLRLKLREDPNHPRPAHTLSREASRARRVGVLAGIAAGALLAGLWLRGALANAIDELDRIEWGFIGEHFGQLLRPDLSAAALGSALRGIPLPLALGWLGTLLAVLGAALLAYPASTAMQWEPERFTGERVAPARRAARALLLGAARALALLLRAVPEAAWALLFAALLRAGPLPALAALALHSCGVLARVYSESVDDVPYRALEPAAAGGRLGAFLYGALPAARSDWTTYAFFQLESNVRTGVLLGILGLGGIGNSFHTAFVEARMPLAGTYLFAMVLLTVLLDRTSRWLKIAGSGVARRA